MCVCVCVCVCVCLCVSFLFCLSVLPTTSLKYFKLSIVFYDSCCTCITISLLSPAE